MYPDVHGAIDLGALSLITARTVYSTPFTTQALGTIKSMLDSYYTPLFAWHGIKQRVCIFNETLIYQQNNQSTNAFGSKSEFKFN